MKRNDVLSSLLDSIIDVQLRGITLEEVLERVQTSIEKVKKDKNEETLIELGANSMLLTEACRKEFLQVEPTHPLDKILNDESVPSHIKELLKKVKSHCVNNNIKAEVTIKKED